MRTSADIPLTSRQIMAEMREGWNDVTIAAHVTGHARPFVYGISTLWKNPYFTVNDVPSLMRHLRDRCRDYWFASELDKPGKVRIRVLEIRPFASRAGNRQ